jgi:lysophospholipase L1-like esterase
LAKGQVIAIGSALVLIVLAAALWPELPRWRLSGTQSIPAQSMHYGTNRLICPPRKKATIAIFGDSHVVGSHMDSEPSGEQAAFGKVLEQSLGAGTTVALYGIGGHTAQMGEAAWVGQTPGADTVIIAYGSNDAAPRGWLSSKKPVPLDDFKAALGRHVSRWQKAGRTVILLVPPPPGSTAMMARLAPYRKAVRDVGQSLDIAVLDPADAFAAAGPSAALLTRDALHMNAAGHRRLGEWLALQLCPDDNR